MKNAARMKTLAVLAVIATLVGGCSREPSRVDMDIPSGGAALQAWADKAAEDNGVKGDYSASSMAPTICQDLIPKNEDLTQVAIELGKWRSVRVWDTSVLLAISIYGYCPQYKSRWESNPTFKNSKVRGVTPIFVK
ncbi:hypothetical protein [Pseudarthrobacter sp. BIM B-2242]|uniref:hypothetical protein n=1 Tax=Pseudarthrobacter sp. BIM B-2242 TaxID=2772401 RepID=UPI00168B0EB6|nr:hypothetical protein [Pseudarthrobacter sp. BIM B-2242]QOD05795.1 hypothetical protein IDT60_22470 [Pseudarthrobacter sp. BIM B-2242]